MRRTFASLAAAAVLVAVPGCTPKEVKVTGKLVKNGQIQTYSEDTYVTLQFVRVDAPEGESSTISAKIDRPAGTYEVRLPPGRYRASLFVPPKNFDQVNPNSVPPPVGSAGSGPEFEFKSDTTQDITVP